MDELPVIRIPIQGEWRAYEWAEIISFIDGMYSDFAIIYIIGELRTRAHEFPDGEKICSNRIKQLIHIIEDPNQNSTEFLQWDAFEIENMWELEIPEVLRVVEIKYGSDGNADFFGFAKIIEALSSVVNNMILFFREKEDRNSKRLENRKKELELIETEINLLVKHDIIKDEDRGEYLRLKFTNQNRKAEKFIKSKRIREKTSALPSPPKWKNERPSLPPPS